MKHTRRAEYGWTVSGNFEFVVLRQLCHCGSAGSAVFAEKKPQIHFLWFVAGGISDADIACAHQDFLQPYACRDREFSAGEAVSGSAAGGKRDFPRG